MSETQRYRLHVMSETQRYRLHVMSETQRHNLYVMSEIQRHRPRAKHSGTGYFSIYYRDMSDLKHSGAGYFSILQRPVSSALKQHWLLQYRRVTSETQRCNLLPYYKAGSHV